MATAADRRFGFTLDMLRARFVTGTIETTVGPHYYKQGNFISNSRSMIYGQFIFSRGCRFDSNTNGE